MRIDLHTHTYASDGELSPTQLMSAAAAAGLHAVAITDHDSTAGLEEAAAACPAGLELINGIELSTRWRTTGIHVIGLCIDPDSIPLQQGIVRQQAARNARAERIARVLAQKGFDGCLEGALALAGTASVGRPHFARYLAQSGQVRDEQEAFKRHLGRGKPGDVHTGWAELPEVIEWIRQAGGIAVLAHPGRYRLGKLKLEELARDFQAAGGTALELMSGMQDAELTAQLTRVATKLGLAASCGSDFHRPDQRWAALGQPMTLPARCTPVWTLPGWRSHAG